MIPILILILVMFCLMIMAVSGFAKKTQLGYPVTPDVERPSAKQVTNFNQQVKKASHNRRHRIEAKKVGVMEGFKNDLLALKSKVMGTKQANPDGFQTIHLVQEEAAGIFAGAFPGLNPLKDTIYYDAMGAKAGKPINYRHTLGQAIEPLVQAWNDEPGSINHKYAAWTSHPHQKSLTTAIWDIPLHAIQGVLEVDEGMNPLATLLPRIATSKVSIGATPRTGRGAWTHLAEATETYNFTDDVFHASNIANYTYDVVGYHRGVKTSALMALSGVNIADPTSSNASSLLLSGRDYEEKQIFQGQNGGNASSFKGVYELAQLSGSSNVELTTTKYPNSIRSMFATMRSAGAKKRTSIGATDSNTMVNIANSLQAFVRTGSAYKNFIVDAPEIGLGLELPFVNIDGHMVFESDGAPTPTGSREIIGMDLKTNSMYMVQDITIHPLSKQGPVDKVGADAFGVFVSEAHPHIARRYGIT